jgi:MYXO-CTERM domain-containing protein
MRNKLLIAVALSAAATFSLVLERDASACGGCFHPPEENPTIVTDHRMILSVSKQQSTLYDQIKYQGDPSSFAWVLPISGTVDVGLSADVVFGALDQTTQTQIISPPQNCPPPPNCNTNRGDSLGAPSSGSSDAGSGGVTVTKQEVVGPYLSVQLKATDPAALQNWLTQNGFAVPADVKPIVDQYVAEKFDFLALKLIPGKGVKDMRPVRVTTKGASVVLPLRMVAAGTGATVGISLWVLAEGRYEAQNFPNFAIKADDLLWDWTQQKSNYTTIRAEKTTASGGRAWETESSTILNQQQIQSTVLNSGSFGNPGPTDPDAGPPPSPDEQRARASYDPVRDAQGAIIKTAMQVRDEDLAALFYGIPASTSRVSRLRADLTHKALEADLVMIASADQSVLSNVRQVLKEANQPLCPVFNGCENVGMVPRDEAIARANASGSGESFSCATSTGSASPLWLGAGLGYLAIAIARSRRRRRP